MAGSVNKVMLIGNLGKDPEVRHSQNGNKIVNLVLATSDSWKDKQTGEKKEKTEWHRVVIFNPNLADIAERFLHKGSKVYIEGSLQTRKWIGNDGKDNYSTEIVLQNYRGEIALLDSKGSGAGGYSGNNDYNSNSSYQSQDNNKDTSGGWDSSPPDFDDDIPF